jgi:hypothetical protein
MFSVNTKALTTLEFGGDSLTEIEEMSSRTSSEDNYQICEIEEKEEFIDDEVIQTQTKFELKKNLVILPVSIL